MPEVGVDEDEVIRETAWVGDEIGGGILAQLATVEDGLSASSGYQ